MKIEINKLLYDSDDERCLCIVRIACGQPYAFIQVVDLGGGTKKYWGPYTHNEDMKELMLTEIMESGGKWPR